MRFRLPSLRRGKSSADAPIANEETTPPDLPTKPVSGALLFQMILTRASMKFDVQGDEGSSVQSVVVKSPDAPGGVAGTVAFYPRAESDDAHLRGYFSIETPVYPLADKFRTKIRSVVENQIPGYKYRDSSSE